VGNQFIIYEEEFSVEKKHWRVEVVWRVGATIDLEAESVEAAQQLAYRFFNLSDFDDPEYVDDSLQVVDVTAID
jgi:hypothetical protein